MTTPKTNLIAGLPASIHLVGAACNVFAAAAVHIRAGMIFCPDFPIEVFNNGQASFVLVQGNPGQAALDLAQESKEEALHLQTIQYERDVKEAAKAMIEQEKRETLAKQVADAEAAYGKAIEKLKKEAAAEIAKLAK